MTIDILTLFPEMFAPLKTSVLGRALDAGVFSLRITDIRAYSKDKHLKCDDYPYGGGAGMIMTPQPIYDAIAAVDPNHEAKRIYLSPKGQTLTAKKAQALAKSERLLFLCGHYEGVDQRVLDLCIDEELSIGDYVLTGGELAAMVAVDALLRFVPGVLGSEESAKDESFSADLLEYPQYTRPRVFMGLEVPSVLVDGHHGNVDKWRASEAKRITAQNRPDLLKEDERP